MHYFRTQSASERKHCILNDRKLAFRSNVRCAHTILSSLFSLSLPFCQYLPNLMVSAMRLPVPNSHFFLHSFVCWMRGHSFVFRAPAAWMDRKHGTCRFPSAHTVDRVSCSIWRLCVNWMKSLSLQRRATASARLINSSDSFSRFEFGPVFLVFFSLAVSSK